MKNLYLLPFLFLFAFASCNGPEGESADIRDEQEVSEQDTGAVEYKVTNDSKVLWGAKKVTGAHHGHINISDGKLMVQNGQIVGGEFTIDMSTIEVEDQEKGSESYNNLMGHLRSDDFFNVEKHPESKFVITEVQQGSGDSIRISGNLTIKDITNNITFNAAKQMDNDDTKIITSTKFNIDRKQWDLMYRQGKGFGDKMIYDDVNFDLKIIAEKNEGVL